MITNHIHRVWDSLVALQPLGRYSRRSKTIAEVLDEDVLYIVLSHLTSHDLAACAAASRCLRAVATPILFGNVALRSYNAMDSFVRTLETSDCDVGQFVRSFAEDAPFLFLETHADAPAPSLLRRLLRLSPNLRSLKLLSPIEIDLSKELAGLTALDELELGDSTPQTLRAVLPHVRGIRSASMTCTSMGWSLPLSAADATVPCYAEGSERQVHPIMAFLIQNAATLERVAMDEELLEPVMGCGAAVALPKLTSVTLHIAYSTGRLDEISAMFPHAALHTCRCLVNHEVHPNGKTARLDTGIGWFGLRELAMITAVTLLMLANLGA